MPTGDKWQSKTLFLLIFDLRSLIVKSIFNCRLSVVKIKPLKCLSELKQAANFLTQPFFYFVGKYADISNESSARR